MDSVPLLDLCKFIEENVDYMPDIIFTHFAGDLNIDHQLVTKALLTAFRPQNGNKTKIYSYYVPSSTDYNPISYFDGNSYFKLNKKNVAAKLKSLRHYDKEMRKYPHTRSYENVHNLIKVWGSEVGLLYCEKFKLPFNEKTEKEAIKWSLQRGNRTGRSAWQFIINYAAENNKKIDF